MQRASSETAVTTPCSAPLTGAFDDVFDRGLRTFRDAFFASFATSSRPLSAIPVTRRAVPSPDVRIPSARSNSGGIIHTYSLACARSPRTRVPRTFQASSPVSRSIAR
ncbi:hypothetical protein ACFQ10_54410 [Streptomyces indonesiensis]